MTLALVLGCGSDDTTGETGPDTNPLEPGETTEVIDPTTGESTTVGVDPDSGETVVVDPDTGEPILDEDGNTMPVDLPTDPGIEDPGDASGGGATVTIEEGAPFTDEEAPAMDWNFVPIPDTYCRNGSQWGVNLNVNPASDKLLVYMEGGGACFNTTTCLANPSSYTPGRPNNALLARDGTNPFADYNMVYLPYCTGDVFTGTAMSGYNGDNMVGHINVMKALERVVPTFKDSVNEIVLSGMSAGGFGVAWNWMYFQDAFGDIPVHALDDSGPPLGPEYLPECLQAHVGGPNIWGWAGSIHPACTDCDASTGRVVRPLMDVALGRAGDQRFALLSNDEDGVIKTFFGYGENDCGSLNSFLSSYPQGKYPAGLDDLFEYTSDATNFRMFEVQGAGHTFFGGANAWQVSSDGQTILDFVRGFVTDDPSWKSSRP